MVQLTRFREGKKALRARREIRRIMSMLLVKDRDIGELAQAISGGRKRVGMLMRRLISDGVVLRRNKYTETTLTHYALSEPFKRVGGTLANMSEHVEVKQTIAELLEEIEPILHAKLARLHELREFLTPQDEAVFFGVLGRFIHTFCHQKVADYDDRMRHAFAEVISDPRTAMLFDSFAILAVGQ